MPHVLDKEYIISRFEDKALQIGDINRAIKLNWLRNSLETDALSIENVIEKVLIIWADK